MTDRSLAHWRASMALLAVFALLGPGSGCAPGDSGVGSSGTGVEQAGVQVGTITGFGSVIVDGNRYDETSASITADIDPSAPAVISAGNLKLGMATQLTYDGTARASSVQVGAAVAGAIDSLTSTGFAVAGQTVRLATSGAGITVLDGLGGLPDLAVGERVSVHGPRGVDEVIEASRIERIDPAAALYTRVLGPVSAVNRTARTLVIGGLTVAWTTATKVLPTGSNFAVGQTLAVWADAAPSAGTLSADVIAVRSASWVEGAPLRAGGVVRDYNRGGNRFTVRGVTVNNAGAVYVNGSSADLASGKPVWVQGRVTDGLLEANTITLLRSETDLANEITGAITDYVAGTRFRVRGSPIDASSATLSFENGSAANLGNGVLVQIRGALVDGVLRASRIKFVLDQDDRSGAFKGVVSGYDPITGRFTMQGIAMRLANTASFADDDGRTLSRAAFVNGIEARVDGQYVEGVYLVGAVRIDDESSGITVEAEGVAYQIDSLTQTFKVDLVPVRYSSLTRIEGDLTSLRAGTPVKVKGAMRAGTLVAAEIKIRP